MQLKRCALPAFIFASLACAQHVRAVTITWTGGAATNAWGTPSNWDLNRIPAAGDDVVIPNMTPDVNVAYPAFAVAAINSLTSAEALTMTGGTLTIEAASTLNGAFAMSNGATLSGAGDVTVNAPMTWTDAGTMSGTGRTIIAAGGSLSLTGGSQKNINRRLENHSANAVWTGGQIQFNQGTFSNESDGVFTASPATNFLWFTFGGNTALTNAGTINKAGAGTWTVSGIPLNNTGTVNVDAGELNVSSGTNTTTMDVDPGATLNFSGSYTHGASSALTGQGTLTFSGGTHNISGTLSTNRIININGAVDFNAPYTFLGTLNVSGTLGGNADATIAGPMNWSGTMAGTGKTIIASSGSLTITNSGGAAVSLNRRLENHSPNMTWNATGGFGISNGATLSNEADGTFTANVGTNFNFGNSGSTFTNAGTFNKVGTGTLGTFAAFVNSGTINLDAGGLSIAGTNTGTIDADAGTTLTLNMSHSPTAALTGQGTLNFAGSTNISCTLSTNRIINIQSGAVNFNAPYTFSGTVNGGFGGSGDATITGTLNWAGGGMLGTGRTIIASGGSLTISGSNGLQRRLENHSANANLINAQFIFTGGTLVNESDGTMTASYSSNSNWANGGGINAIINNGTFNKTGAGTLAFISNLPFSNLGILNVQTGTLSLASGLTNFSGGNTLIDGTFNVAGTLQFLNANIVTNSANIILDGPTSAIQNTSASNALASFTTNIASGAFQIKNGRNFSRSGSFSNAGLVTVGPGNSTFSIDTFTNSGTIDLRSGMLAISTSLTNYSGTTLTGGTYIVAGTLRFNSADIVTNAANVILDGPASSIENTTAVNALANFATNAAAGSFQIKNGRNYSRIGGFSNSGQVRVGPGASTFTTSVDYVQSSGGTTLEGGTLDPAGIADIQGGELKGNGSILANVTNSGTCKPGLSPGGISITGDYTQTVAGTLEAEIGGTIAVTQYDRLSVTGHAILLGTLRVLVINGFVPSIGNAFDIVTGDISTKFGTINLPLLPNPRGWSIDDSSGALRLIVTDCGPDTNGNGVGDNCETVPDLSWYTIDGGGRTFSSGGVFRVGATIGQHDASSFTAPLTGGGFTLVGGFWPGTETVEAPTCSLPGDMNLDGNRNGIDIRLFANCVLSAGGTSCDCADMDGNSQVNTADIAPFIQLLIN